MERFLSMLYDLDHPRYVEANRRGEITPDQKLFLDNIVSFYAALKQQGPLLLVAFLAFWACLFFSALLFNQGVSQAVVLAADAIVIAGTLAYLSRRLARYFRWRSKTKLDLAGSSIAQTTGQVRWGRKTFEVHSPHGRLRLPYAERDDLQPGSRYRFYFLPQSKTVLSAELLEPAAEDEVSRGLTEILARANNLSLEALTENRMGKLSRKQMTLFLPDIALSISMIVLPGAFVFYQFNQRGFSMDPRTLEWGTLLVGTVSIGLILFGLYRIATSLADMLGGWVDSVEGIGLKRIAVSEDSEGDTTSTYYYCVNGMDFKVKEEGYHALVENRPYRVFFTPRSRKMVNIEAL